MSAGAGSSIELFVRFGADRDGGAEHSAPWHYSGHLLTVIPPAAAWCVSRNLRQQILFSLLIGLSGSVGGVILSYQLDALRPTIV